MEEKNYILSDEIVFNSKPIAVPYNYRISYKISQLMLILSICCSKGGCSLIKLHMISMAFNSNEVMEQLRNLSNGQLTEVPVIRFDPAVTRAALFAKSENLIVQQKDGKLRLSSIGKNYVTSIMQEEDLMIREKRFLSEISTKITEGTIKEIMSNWRYQNVTN
ncbi:MAG: hypothetical protein IJB52_12630 [Clostridia bacterium]|nr:hypothetical protein [Clostridia bacterium]